MGKGNLTVGNSASTVGIVITEILHNRQPIQLPSEIMGKNILFGDISDPISLEQGYYQITASIPSIANSSDTKDALIEPNETTHIIFDKIPHEQ